MISKNYIILASDGIHARPATALLKLAREFKSAIHVAKNNKTVRLNSMLNLLTLAPKFGDTITVYVEGEDEQEALNAIGHFFTEDLKNF